MIRPWDAKGCTGSRGDILQALLTAIEERYPGRVDFRWECHVELDQNTDALDPEYLQVMNGHPFTVAGAVNGRDKDDPRWFCMVGFNHDHRFGSGCCGGDDEPVEAARAYFDRHTDMGRYISDEEIQRFVERDCHHIGKSVTCSTLVGPKVVLPGDAAAAGPPIGQGINAAMEAAVVFEEALESCGGGQTPGELSAAATEFERRWKPEADAATWIANRWAFSNVRMSAKILLAELANCSVLTEAKHMKYSRVYEAAQRRLAWMGPLRRLAAPKALPALREWQRRLRPGRLRAHRMHEYRRCSSRNQKTREQKALGSKWRRRESKTKSRNSLTH